MKTTTKKTSKVISPAKIIRPFAGAEDYMPVKGKKFELKEMQEIVGGLIEVVSIGNRKVMVVNEEGKLLGLLPNLEATKLAQGYLMPGDYIAGTAIIATAGMIG